jgi:hypothetical protein
MARRKPWRNDPSPEQADKAMRVNGRTSDAISKNHKNVHSFIRGDGNAVLHDGPKRFIPSGAFNPR